MNPFLILVIIHWVADFFCQTDDMAINKSKSNYWLTIHVLVYSAVLIVGTGFLNFEPGRWVPFFMINGVLHWITDYYTSRWTSYLFQKAEKHPFEKVYLNSWRHWFFTVIGIDQVIHYACLFLTYQYLIS